LVDSPEILPVLRNARRLKRGLEADGQHSWQPGEKLPHHLLSLAWLLQEEVVIAARELDYRFQLTIAMAEYTGASLGRTEGWIELGSL
jgi:hypothetical protein